MPFQLLQLAEKEGIVVEYWELKEPLEAVYWSNEGLATIGISKSLLNNRAHYRTVLAEELGHHFTSGRNSLSKTYFHHKDRININREEYRALKWAAKYLIPGDKLYMALRKGLHEPWRLAEYFNVDESLVEIMFEHLDLKPLSISPEWREFAAVGLNRLTGIRGNY